MWGHDADSPMCQKFINFLIRETKLTKNPNNVRRRQFTCTRIDGSCSSPTLNDTQVYVVISLSMPEKRTPTANQYAQQFLGLEGWYVFRHEPP